MLDLVSLKQFYSPLPRHNTDKIRLSGKIALESPQSINMTYDK